MTKNKNQPSKHALIPSVGELLTFPVVAFLLLLLFNHDKILAHYGIELGGYDFSESIISMRDSLTDNILPNMATALVWAVVGLAVYLVVWLLIDSSSKAAQATSRAQRFVYPSKDSRHAFAVTIFGQLAVRAVATLALVVWVLGIASVVSWSGNYFYEMTLLENLPDVLLGLSAVFVLGLYLFVGAPITRLIFLRPRVLSD
jgi:hypothetical protein